MKLVALALMPFLASALIAQMPADANGGRVTREEEDALLPGCGPFVRKNPVEQHTIHDDLGECQTTTTYLPDFVYKRTVTEDVYTGGSKFFCSGWTIIAGGCGIGARPFPNRPENCCSSRKTDKEQIDRGDADARF